MVSSIAAVVLLVAGILVAVNVSGGRAYADLPTCRQLLGDLTDDIPGAERPQIDGDLDDESGAHEDSDGLESVLACTVDDSGRDSAGYAVSVSVALFDHEDERGQERRIGDLEGRVEDYAEGRGTDEYEGLTNLEWEQVDVGDGGIATVDEFEVFEGETSSSAHGYFLTQNLSVTYSFQLDDGDDEEEALEFIRSLGPDLEDRLRSESEFV